MSEENKGLFNHYIDREIEEDIQNETFHRDITTRFPPEPNGYLHIGSAYAINMNYTMAKKHNGKFNLRFDDTNPLKEEQEYADSIIEDINWLGYSPGDRIFYGSDYSNKFFDYAIFLIKKGKAYVDDLSPEEITEYRGLYTEPGKNSPYRDRSVEENLDLFYRMKNGEFETGAKVLRAKIDMASDNMNLRDPILYRIIHAEHYRTGNAWCVYPMYDYAHPIQDAIEGVTHSLCSMEFKDHRPLYDWVLTELELNEPPKQREFGRINLTGVVTSKRYLRELVLGGFVDGWDDPRLPTIKGLRRRGFTPESIQNFVNDIGFSKHVSTVDFSMLEQNLRNDLKLKVHTPMAVIDPLKVVITNYEEGTSEMVWVDNNKENNELGKREVPFSRVIYIEKEDFKEVATKKFIRLTLGGEVRLMGAYFIKCNEVIKDEKGEIVELHCTYDPETKSGTGFEGRKVKGTIHWVSEQHATKATVHLYDKLFVDDEIAKDPDKSWNEKINPLSKITMTNAMVEPTLRNAKPEEKFQFLRNGYFTVDKDSTSENLVFNRIVSLRDSKKNK